MRCVVVCCVCLEKKGGFFLCFFFWRMDIWVGLGRFGNVTVFWGLVFLQLVGFGGGGLPRLG